TAALDLDLGLDGVERLPEHVERVLLVALLDHVERAVEDLLGGGALATQHHDVAELGDHPIVVLRIGEDLALRDFAAAGHLDLPMLYGRFMPNLARPCVRFALFVLEGPAAPDASSAPRTTW